ncbi:hypothetical protein ACFVUT_26945, partial [Streptomyces sp. NPDC058051]
GKNPGRAAGAVTFNVLTTVFTGGAGGAAAGAGKAGAVAKVLSVAGKAGKVIDPMTYIAKGAGAGLSKIGDITKGLKGIGNIEIPTLPDNAITLPEGSFKLPDGTIHLPDGAAVPDGGIKLPDGNVKLPDDVPVLPENTTKLPTHADTPVQYFDHDGNLLDHNGDIVQHAKDAPVEATPTTPHTDTPDTTTPHTDTPSPTREPALVGAGAHTADNAAHAATSPDQAVHLGNSLDTDLGDIGRVGDDVPGSTTPHVGDNLPGGHAGDNLPSAHAGDTTLPPSSHVPAGQVADHLPPPSRVADGPDTGPAPGHGGPGGSTTDTLPRLPETPGAGNVDDLGRAGDDATDGAGRGTDDAPGEHGDGTGHDDGPAHTDDADGPNPADDQPDAVDPDPKPGSDDPYAGHEPDYSRPALLPADGPLTLRDVRNTRDVRTRWERGEEFHRQMWGGGPERHYPVPTSEGSRYPVTASGGRKVDVPVDMPDGRTVAVEVKTYGPYRTLTLKDGTHQTIKNEVPLSAHIKEQIHKDIALRNMDPGYDPRWSFTHAGPSAELRNYLKEAKIIFLEYGPSPK